jgi:hypothetical protein
MLGGVSVPNRVRVVLEIKPARPTVSGRLAVDGADVGGFDGWLELIDELERTSSRPSLAVRGIRRPRLVAEACTAGHARVAERAFIAALNEKYGACELEVQVQPVAVKRAVAVGAAIVGSRGEWKWLGSDEIRVSTIADPETASVREWIAAPDGDAALFLADVDSRHATAIRVKLSDLHPDLGRAGSARRSQDRFTDTQSQLADDRGDTGRRTCTAASANPDSGFLAGDASNNSLGPVSSADGAVPAHPIDGSLP